VNLHLAHRRSLVLALAAFSSLSPTLSGAQSSSSKDTPKPKPNTDRATENAPDQPIWDPLRAEKDLEVGQYYMKKGDVDAAIDRFQDAALAKPGYAIPFRLLGEAQEKKGLKREAIKSYTRYLDLFPRAEDKDKIEKKIEKLRAEVEKSKKKSRG
jgi:tetratricopeptide (TPR) repeat protein